MWGGPSLCPCPWRNVYLSGKDTAHCLPDTPGCCRSLSNCGQLCVVVYHVMGHAPLRNINSFSSVPDLVSNHSRPVSCLKSSKEQPKEIILPLPPRRKVKGWQMGSGFLHESSQIAPRGHQALVAFRRLGIAANVFAFC